MKKEENNYENKWFFKFDRGLPYLQLSGNVNLDKSGSDRGNYEDFCLAKDENNSTTVDEIKKHFNDKVLNKEFNGYKGGDFVMGKNTTIKFGEEYLGGVEILGWGVKYGEINIYTVDYTKELEWM